MPDTITFTVADQEITIIIRPKDSTPTKSISQLTAQEREILKACSAEPQSAKRIAAKVERTCSGYFYAVIRGLCNHGHLVRVAGGGYRLKNAPVHFSPEEVSEDVLSPRFAAADSNGRHSGTTR